MATSHHTLSFVALTLKIAYFIEFSSQPRYLLFLLNIFYTIETIIVIFQ